MYTFFKLIRFSQWQKNFLVFLPFIMANEYNFSNIQNSVIGFFIFSFAASVVYIFNDFIDLSKDKLHPTKKLRPIASGAISHSKAKLILIFFLFLSLFLGFLNKVLIIILAYFSLNIIYSIIAKKIKYIDILLLSSFYIIRIYFGGELNNVEISLWLYIFCTLAFISLVIIKRVNEIKKYEFLKILYSIKDFQYLSFFLKFSNIGSIFCLIFYFSSEKVKQIYHFPEFLWALLPLYIFWIININKKAILGKMNDDPVTFVFTNKKSYISIMLMGLVILIAQLIKL
tara:strand:- start:375 stop:1229 length:855 start_codon:yes stop_codon:yes gene_type:complete